MSKFVTIGGTNHSLCSQHCFVPHFHSSGAVSDSSISWVRWLVTIPPPKFCRPTNRHSLASYLIQITEICRFYDTAFTICINSVFYSNYLSHCYTIAWDRLSNQFVCVCLCMYVCMYVCVGTLMVTFFIQPSRNLIRTFGVWIRRTDYVGVEIRKCLPLF